MTTYTSPLSIYVVWHPKFESGSIYANRIYSTFCRDTSTPFTRGLGIPVSFRSIPLASYTTPAPISLHESDRNAIVVLIDDEMYEDDQWNSYVKGLLKNIRNTDRVFPVSCSAYAFELDENLSKTQFIQLHKIIEWDKEQEFERRFHKLKSNLLHDFSRMLLSMSPTYLASPETENPPVKLFISHAKKDGENEAISLRDYINAHTKLKSFFDANDIANGYEFESEIRKGIMNSALVVFHSDEYSNREWCRIEVIIAKRFKCPMVVVNAITKGEIRSFPYLGNVPTIRWNNNFEDIIDLALVQVLNNLYSKEQLKKQVQLYELDKSDYTIGEISMAPELFNFIDVKSSVYHDNTKERIIIIYPDPPLGSEEMNVLNDFDNKVQFLTPILIPSL